MANPKITIGSISHGTLRPEDFLRVFSEELERVSPDLQDCGQRDAKIIAEAREILAHPSAATGSLYITPSMSERIEWCVADLIDALDCYAPSGMYFGAHVGDGSDFGFWPID